MKNPNYGSDFVGWLSYITHKKETMEYIEYLEEELKKEQSKNKSLEEKKSELRKKIRVKRKSENGKKRIKKETN